MPLKNKYLGSFITGYQKIRKLLKEELKAIPYFEMISIIWALTIYVDNANRIGHSMLHKQLWDERIDRIKAIEENIEQLDF